MSKKLVGKELSPITRTDFWPAVNSRFMELQNELDLKDFSFIAFAFVELELLDYSNFLDLSRKALLLNSHLLNIRDLAMLLTICKRLEKDSSSSKYQEMFNDIMAECLEVVMP